MKLYFFLAAAFVFIVCRAIGLIHVSPWRMWRYMLSKNWGESRIGLFKNLPWVKPGRWGFYILGFEFGSRNPGNKVGLWLKNHGLYPW